MSGWPFVLAVLVVLWFASSWLLTRLAHRLPEADERHPITTEDGWLLTLHRFRPPTDVPRQPVPVIFGHGLNMNRASWMLSPEASLPHELARRGHDVFVAEYRGTASSRPPQRGDTSGRWTYSVEDHARLDLPAIIDGVARITDSDTISWIGHSMGGMVLYLYAAAFGSDRIHRAVTLGSPVRFGSLFGLSPRTLSFGLRLLPKARRSHLVGPTFTVLPAGALAWRWVLKWCMNPRYFNLREALTLMWTALEDVSGPVHAFFLERNILVEDLCPDPDEGLLGLEVGGLRRLTSPLLIIAGELDRIAKPTAVQPAFERAGSEWAAFKHFGSPDARDSGPPFGHCDLASSREAVRHIAPVLCSWLEGSEPRIQGATLARAPDDSPTRQAS